MRIGFVVNDLETEEVTYTTTRLAAAATRMGHQTWTLGVSDFIYATDGSVHALARSPRRNDHDSLKSFLEDLQGEDANEERITVDDLDILLLRNNPADDIDRPWAQVSGMLFGQLAVERGVVVLNDPKNLSAAMNKTYFQHFPEEVRPRACISRTAEEIKQFLKEQGGKIVIKPLQGSGGQGVFVLRAEEEANVNQMIDAVIRDGYCVAQEYLPAAVEGDVRLFVMNGRPLEWNGRYAAFRRVNKTGDARSNMHSGGIAEPAEVTPDMLELVEMCRPKLVRDGMWLVGLDIVADKLMEINVFSPGGLGSAEAMTGVDFTEAVIRDLERKLKYKSYYDGRVSNCELATL